MESSTRAPKPSGAALWSTFPFGSGSIRGWTTARANYFNPSTNTSAFRPRSFRARLYSSTCRCGIKFGLQRGVCRRHRIRDATGLCVRGENNGRRPCGWIRRTCAYWRRGPRYREVATNIPVSRGTVYRRAEHGLSLSSNISRSHSDSPFPLRLLARCINIPSSNGIAGHLRGSELPRRIHRFIMLRIPSADNHVLRATRFAWNSGSFELTREHYMHNTIRYIPFV